MKKFLKLFLLFCLLIVFSWSCNQPNQNANKNQGKANLNQNQPVLSGETNNFYNDVESYDLPLSALIIEGEIENPGPVDLSLMPLHSVIVKEARLTENGDEFIGAYRYDGYSLIDILNNRKIDKKNAREFEPIIDLYIEVENADGEKVVVSWGEIYYPVHLHEIIIATQVMRIVPSRTKDLWPLPMESKLIVATDLITERNISAPAKITVKSYPKSFETVKGLKPLYSAELNIFVENNKVETLIALPEGTRLQNYPTIFYGRGHGIHSTQPFIGVMLKDVLGKYVSLTSENLRTGIFVTAAFDGYRGVYTYSELMNRNDQSEVLLIYYPEGTDGGAFRLFPSGDFFSDRAIKAVNEIYFLANEN